MVAARGPGSRVPGNTRPGCRSVQLVHPPTSRRRQDHAAFRVEPAAPCGAGGARAGRLADPGCGQHRTTHRSARRRAWVYRSVYRHGVRAAGQARSAQHSSTMSTPEPASDNKQPDLPKVVEPETPDTRLVQSIDVMTGRRSRLIEMTPKKDARITRWGISR